MRTLRTCYFATCSVLILLHTSTCVHSQQAPDHPTDTHARGTRETKKTILLLHAHASCGRGVRRGERGGRDRGGGARKILGGAAECGGAAGVDICACGRVERETRSRRVRLPFFLTKKSMCLVRPRIGTDEARGAALQRCTLLYTHTHSVARMYAYGWKERQAAADAPLQRCSCTRIHTLSAAACLSFNSHALCMYTKQRRLAHRRWRACRTCFRCPHAAIYACY
jgi:hypothetical protein